MSPYRENAPMEEDHQEHATVFFCLLLGFLGLLLGGIRGHLISSSSGSPESSNPCVDTILQNAHGYHSDEPWECPSEGQVLMFEHQNWICRCPHGISEGPPEQNQRKP